jgi:hypothetical protein
MSLTKTQPANTYQLKLMENGIDFVKSGIETFFGEDSPDPRAHKYAILHMFSGVLLLLKERLARIRPSLVFENEAQCGKPGARTTNYHRTIERLAANGVTIDPAKRTVLDRVQRLRNDIEHYEVSLELAQTKEVIGELAAFAYWFCLDELQLRLDGRLSRESLEHFYELKEIGDRLMQEMIESAAAEAEEEDAYFRAFEEKYRAMTPDELLNQVASDRGVTLAAIERIECPSCDEPTLLLLEVGACINPACRATPRLGECHYCQGVAFGRAYLCEGCRYG